MSTADVMLIAQNLGRNCGYAVFPCQESKRPACTHGFKDGSRNPDAVADLWRRYPGPLIGVATGEMSGIDALDIDVKHASGRAWLSNAADRMPSTRTHQTRSGGFHLLFRHAPGVRNTESVIAKGVDTRGQGGFVIWWPAHGFPCTDHSPIAEWPEWLLESLFYTPEPQPTPPRVRTYVSAGTSAQNLVAASLRKVRAAVEGGRHSTLRAASRTIGGVLHLAGLSESDAAEQLLAAVIDAGGAAVNQRNARATIAWGLEKGRREPLGLDKR